MNYVRYANTCTWSKSAHPSSCSYPRSQMRPLSCHTAAIAKERRPRRNRVPWECFFPFLQAYPSQIGSMYLTQFPSPADIPIPIRVFQVSTPPTPISSISPLSSTVDFGRRRRRHRVESVQARVPQMRGEGAAATAAALFLTNGLSLSRTQTHTLTFGAA